MSKRYDNSVHGDSQLGQSIVGQISLPIFEGGVTLSRSRQARQMLGQRELESDVARDQVRAMTVTAWGQLFSSRTQMLIARTQYESASRELSDVTQQYRYGQKALIDVLNASQDVLDAGSNLIAASRDRIVASFAVLRAVGQLTLASVDTALRDAPVVKVGRFPEPDQRTVPDGIVLKPSYSVPLNSCWLECPASPDDAGLRSSLELKTDRSPGPVIVSRKTPDFGSLGLKR